MDGFEFDVQFSRDDVPFVFHDDSLKRLAGRDEVAARLPWRELRGLELKDPARPDLSPGRIPSLDEVLAGVPGGLAINLEIKNQVQMSPEHLAKIVNLIRAHRLEEKTLVSSFNHAYLRTIAERDPSLALAALWVQAPNESEVLAMKEMTMVAHLGLGFSSAAVVDGLRGCGCAVAIWGLTGVEDVERCVGLGVEAMFLDDPSWVAGVHREGRRPATEREE